MNGTLDVTTTRESQELANHATGTRGRRPAARSRSSEIREKLAAWKQTPESSRPTLRALAQELGTSHQLLGHFLKNWASKKLQAETHPFDTLNT
jgi:hypothetical protein